MTRLAHGPLAPMRLALIPIFSGNV